MKIFLPREVVFILFFLFVFSERAMGQTVTSGAAYIWSTVATWTPTAVPASTSNVTVNNPLTLDQNLIISSGNYVFNKDVTDQPGGSNYNLTNSNASGSLTIASGTTTIGGITSIGGNTTFSLTVKNGATLIMGTPNSTLNNFLIGDKVNITIEQGASLIVYGNIVNSNSSGTFIVNGLLQVFGNYSTNNGNIDVSGTTGQFYTTGAMQTQGTSSQIYGSSNDCTSNCSGTSLGCGTSGSSYTATIIPQSQTVCSGGSVSSLTFSTSAPSPSYQWEYSLSSGGTYTAISGATSNTYTPSAVMVTTWYRVKYTSSASGCGTKYSAPVPVYVSASTFTQSTSGQSVCGGVFGPISVSAHGDSLIYQWYSNVSATNSGGTFISGATSNIYTPPSAVAGTKYYYCVINSSCGIPFTTAVSGAFTVNLNTAVTASPSPVVCMNTLMTNITHTTTGATGIGTPTGLPDGVTASWASNTITISDTPTVSGTFNYSIPLTGGCGVVNATGTITVNTLPNNITNGFSATTICAGGNPQLTFDAEDATFSTPYSITYRNDATLVQYTVAIPSAAPYSFVPPDNPTINTGYTLVSVSNATCTRTSGFLDSGANLRVRPMPIAIISGSTSVCMGDSAPNITFTNPQSVAVIVTYRINGGADQLINIAANGTAVIAVATTIADTYHYDLVSVVYQSTPNCSNTISGRATVVVNPNLFASVSISASPSGAICSGTSVTFTAVPTNGGTSPSYQWKLNGVNVGSNSTTYTNAEMANGDIVTCVMTSNATPCLTASPATSNEITMIVNTVPAEPVVESITQPTCKELTASVELSGLPATGTWTINPGGYTGTGITTTISGLAVTTYNFTVSTGNCTSAPSAAVIITPVVITTYNGTSWSSTPDSTKAGVVSGSGIISVDTDLCSCTVDANVITSVASGITLRLQDKLTVNGTLTFENNASLVQVNDDAVNTGNIIYKRNTTPVNRYDYTYWSSPVAGFTLKKLSPFTLFDRYFSYDDGWKVSLSGVDVMKAGHGYIVRAPQTYPISGSPSPYPARFEGVPNNGIFNLMLIANKDYLLGNPYPSAISADQFLEDNQAALQGTLYFWTHNSPPVAASGTTTYKYTASDYASYNRTGGTKAAASGGDEPLGKIAASQGFFAPASTTGGLVVFNNDMRIRGGIAGIDNAQFFKLIENSKLKTPTSLTEKTRIWLNLTNNEGAFKQTLIGYIKGATNEYDNGFDGVSYNGNQFVDFYSINQDKNLAIQGRALPFVQKDSIALGYKSTIKGDFQISIDHTDGILSSQQVFLEDKAMKLLHDLKNSPYVFSTEVGVFNDRFVLRYEDKSIVGKIKEEEPLAVNDQVIVSVRNNEITVSSFSDLITNITIYDVLGQRVYQKEEITINSFTIQNLNLANQVLLVQLTLESGETISTKIVY